MTEKEVIKQLLGIIYQSTLPVQGNALRAVNELLAYAEHLADAPSNVPTQPEEPNDGQPVITDAVFLGGDRESD